MPIKAVFFDAAGTLIKPVRRVGESYAEFAGKYGIDVAPSQLSERFRVCFGASSPLAFPGAPASKIDALERAWWERLVRRILEPWEPFDRFDDYFAELFAYFARPESWELYPEVPDTLSALKARGLTLSVISNFDSRLVRILDGLGAGPAFEEILISSRAGYAKPDRRIFSAALARHSVEAREAAHVGDSEDNDLRGAIDAGLKGILVDRNGESPAIVGTRVVTLKEILPLLED